MSPTAEHETPTCPLCGKSGAAVFFRVDRAPVFCNTLSATREEALAAPRAPIHLAHCPHCELVFNAVFDESALSYDATYENSLHYSPRFQQFARQLAKRLVERFDLHGKQIIEIGCGGGDFLAMLCEAGGNVGVGFDPGHNPARAASVESGELRFVAENYTREHRAVPADMICCRHVLEHIPRPVDFLEEIARIAGTDRGASCYFEVPNVLWTLRELGIWDILYEHCSYFSPVSLTAAFVAAGYQPLDVQEAYDRQFVGIDANLPGSDRMAATVPAGESIVTWVERFAERFADKIGRWRVVFDELRQAGRRAVVWGVGTKGVMFLNMLDLDLGCVEHVVDLNPHKHGAFVAGTGQLIVSPEEISEDPPYLVVVMNPVYEPEIRVMLASVAPNADVMVA